MRPFFLRIEILDITGELFNFSEDEKNCPAQRSDSIQQIISPDLALLGERFLSRHDVGFA